MSRRRFWRNPSRFLQNLSSSQFLDDLQSPNHNPTSTSTQAAMEGATCIVEEEFPGEFLHLDSIASIQDTDSQVGTTTEEVKAVEVMDTAQEDLGRGGGPPSLGASTTHCSP
jgi:hypothetical protein